MNPIEFVEHLKRTREYRQQIVHVQRIPARAARYGSLKRPLPKALQEALRDAGTDKLYLHQAQAINAIRDGQNVVVATSTASGKTLVYNLPVLEVDPGGPAVARPLPVSHQGPGAGSAALAAAVDAAICAAPSALWHLRRRHAAGARAGACASQPRSS